MKRDILISIFLLVLSVNPLTEEAEFYSPLPYMLSHYALVSSGVLLGYSYLKGNKYNLLLGILPVVLWHLPYYFALGASSLGWRIVLELSIFLGGILIGSSLGVTPKWGKVALFVLYMLGDTVLSILFILESPSYTNLFYPFSPYSPSTLPTTGIAMVVVMNVVLAVVIYLAFKDILRGLTD